MENCIASCLTNVDGDYVSLAKKALRLGLATIYTAQIGLEMTQDILFGTPMPHEVNVDLGIMDPDYVNIAFNGHQPWIGVATLQIAKKPEYQEMARKAGAKGLRIVGSIETGQELLQRFTVDDVFVGLMGNWLAIEPLLATGTVDALVMEENCSPPAIDQYAEKISSCPYQCQHHHRRTRNRTSNALLSGKSRRNGGKCHQDSYREFPKETWQNRTTSPPENTKSHCWLFYGSSIKSNR